MRNFALLLGLIAACGISATICHGNSSVATANHPFSHVQIAYSHNECSFLYSPVDFCDERHVSEIKNALGNQVANFDGHYILLKIKEWRPSEYYGNSIVAIDTESGVVYPMPFDYYTGEINMTDAKVTKRPGLTFSAGSKKVCIDGSILVYRATTNGHFCFYFDGHKFSGFHTEYMN